MSTEQANLATCDVSTLINAAVQAGIRLHTEPEPLFVYGERTDETDRIAAVLNVRSEEVAATLRATRDAPPLISEEEARYRREVMREPEMPIGELPWPVLKAMIVGLVHDTMQMIEAEREWERSRADVRPSKSTTRTPRPRKSAPDPARVVF